MKIKAEQLARSLRGDSQPLFWITGDEPLLIQEAADLVRKHCRDREFSERELYTVDRSFNWEQFRQSTGNLSLFAERKLIELRLQSSKLDDAGKLALADFLESENPDIVVLITSPKLEGSTMNTKWFKSIEGRSLVVQIWPVKRDELPSWLERRLVQAGIHPKPDALQLLIDRIEGNLLAAMQEIEKLKLLAGSDETISLDAQTVMQVVADSSRYNAYQLVDAALLGDLPRTQKILNGLQAEGIFPLLVLGAITRELRTLLPMIEKRESGQAVQAILQSNRVWFNRKQAVGAAISRLRRPLVWSLLEQARHIDQACKGMSSANPWDELSLLLIRLSGADVSTANVDTLNTA